jgi:hypothetical protein
MNFEELGNKYNYEWSNILGAQQKSAENKKIIFDALVSHGMPAFSNDMDLVLFGSIARNECTAASDVDWTLLIDGQSNPYHDNIGRIVRKKLSESSLIDPSPSGLFGQLTFSHDLIHFIGGQEDTNFNITRRILLLLESEPIIARADEEQSNIAYDRVVRGILESYISNDSAFHSHHSKKDNVPRFLLNDIVRFWRTMCVDFAYKQREQDGQKWALRNIKLRMSRKLIFIKGLLMCAAFYKEKDISQLDLIKKLYKIVASPALEFVTGELIRYKIDNKLVIQLLNCYDAFLDLLNDEALREHIKNLSMKEVYDDSKFLKARKNANSFQQALTQIFFYENTPLKEFTITYGVF